VTTKQRIGDWLVDRLGINPQFFRALWLEIRAAWIRLRGYVEPVQILRLRVLRHRKGVLANVGCGPTGREGWVNIDLFKGPGVTVRFDCRRRLPLGDASCRGIHVEHYFEHLEFHVERPHFLADCLRCLEPGGVLRIVVPDARKFMEAYVAPGWAEMNELGGGYYVPEQAYRAKIQAVNHTFLQSGDHFGGYDADYLGSLLEEAGFRDVRVVDWRVGSFPGGCIDVEQHRVYSLYMEARR
jgi:predicted SAM-dependent methyltransferase